MKFYLKMVLKKIMNIHLWFITVFCQHNNTNLRIYQKLRAIRYGFSNDLYSMYQLDKNNPNLYINEYIRMRTREIDGEYKTILDNKLLFEQLFSKYVQIPKTVIIITDNIYSVKDGIIKQELLSKLLIKDKYIMKPISGTGGGYGVSLIKKIENSKYLFNGCELTGEQLYDKLKKYKNYIVSEYVNQHEYSNTINPYSVNTIRIITIKDPKTGDFIIPCAVHRFGSKKSGIVDNASAGGFISNINIEKGILLETKSFSNLKSIDKHPDTRAQINGIKIPHWEEIKSKLIEVAKQFPYIPFIAWDIVVTDDGFSIIEGNTSSGLNIFQIFGPIKNSKLGEFYKYYGYLK